MRWLKKSFGIYSSQLAKNALKLSSMVGENFGIYSSQLAKNALKLSTMIGKKLEFTHHNWPKTHLNFPPWLKTIFEFTHLNWRKMHLNCPSWWENQINILKQKEQKELTGKIFYLLEIAFSTFSSSHYTEKYVFPAFPAKNEKRPLFQLFQQKWQPCIRHNRVQLGVRNWKS